MNAKAATDVKSACTFVRSCLGEQPVVTCVAERGTLDLGEFFDDSPNLWRPESSSSDPAPFKVYCGRIGSIPVIAVTESPPFFPARKRTFPIELAAACDCGTAILLATAIPLNPEWQAGEIMVVEDHINLLGDTPLIGRAASSAIPFLDMGNAYDRTLLDEAMAAAEMERFSLKRGVFVASPLAQSYDPSALESLRQAGGDACGTGIVPHVLTARDASIAVLALGTIRGMDTSDAALNLALTSTRASEETATRLTAILRRLIRGHVEDTSGGNAPESRLLSESSCGGGSH